jgi:ankyrin repeat protein
MSVCRVTRAVASCLSGIMFWALASAAFAATNDERLITAVKTKEFDSVAALLRENVDVNATSADGTTALHWASHWGNIQTASRLITAGARLDAATAYGVTPLMIACENKLYDVVGALLSAGANTNLARLSGETALMIAARTGDPRIVRALLARGADVNAKEHRQHQTALMRAAAAKHPELVRALVEGGANIHARSRVTSSIVNRGDPGGRRTGYVWVGEAKFGGYTPILFAAQQGDVDSAKILLDAGADPNDHAADGMTPLILAAYGRHVSLADLLLARHADPNDNGPGYTAAHVAVLSGRVDFVQSLVKHGVDINARLIKGTPIRRQAEDLMLPETLRGATPVLLAAKFLEPEILELLIRSGASLDSRAEDGSSVLTYAVGGGPEVGYRVDRRSRNVPAIVRETTGAGADEEARALAITKVLVNAGVDVNLPDSRGDTAVHHAVRKGFGAVVEFLAQSGANLNSANKTGLTPLAMAARPARGDAEGGGAPAKNSLGPLLQKLGAIR